MQSYNPPCLCDDKPVRETFPFQWVSPIFCLLTINRTCKNGPSQWKKTLHTQRLLSLAEAVLVWSEIIDSKQDSHLRITIYLLYIFRVRHLRTVSIQRYLLTRIINRHYKDKTVSPLPYLYNRNSYIRKTGLYNETLYRFSNQIDILYTWWRHQMETFSA